MRWIVLTMLLLLTAVSPLRAEDTAVPGYPPDAQEQGQPLNGEDEQAEPADADDSEHVYELDPVVVSAPVIVRERRAENLEKAVTTTEIAQTDIEDKSAKVLKDVLYQVPGIQISPQRKGTTEFTMRGYDQSKVAMLVDGIPLIESFDGGMDIDNIGLLDISEIIVSRGTTSALYGTRGCTGSINLITREPEHLYTKFSTEFGRHGNYVTSLSNGAPVGNFYYYLSALYDKSNGYEVSKNLDRSEREAWLKKLSRYDLYGFTLDDIYSHPGASAAVYYLNDEGLWDHTGHEKYKLNGKIGYHLTPDLEVGATSFYNITKMENSSYFTDMRSMYTYNSYTQEMDWRLPDTTYILRNRSSLWPQYDDYAISPFMDYRSGKFSLKANAFYYDQSNKFLAYDDPLENVLAFNRDEITMTWSIWTSKTYGLNLYPSYKLLPWNNLNFAMTYYTSSHKEEDQAYNDEATDIIEDYGKGKYETLNMEANYLTLAVEDEMRIRDNVTLTLGVSYDAQDLTRYQKKLDIKGSREMIDQYLAEDDAMLWGTRDSLNPVAGVMYEPIKDFLTIRAAASRKTAFPTLRAYSKTVSPYQESSDLGSRDVQIKPETITNANAGAQLSFLSGRLIWGADYFFSKYDDKITRIYITKSDDYIYRNIDAAVIHGIETTLNYYLYDIFDSVDVGASSTYTYMYSRNQADVEDSFVNKGDRFERLPEHKFTFDLRADFRTGTSLFIFGNLEFNQIQYVMGSVPQTKADFSTDYFYAQNLHDPIKIDIKLSQKLFKRFEVYFLCQNILDDYDADPFNPGPGRSWFAGFKVNL